MQKIIRYHNDLAAAAKTVQAMQALGLEVEIEAQGSWLRGRDSDWNLSRCRVESLSKKSAVVLVGAGEGPKKDGRVRLRPDPSVAGTSIEAEIRITGIDR
jgi:hypothetical protein